MPAQEQTAAFKLFNYLYRVYIPQHHMYSNEYLKQFGIPTSGDSALDKAQANEMTLTQQTIAGMAELHADGAAIALEDPSKSVEIYEILRNHLNDWSRAVHEAFHDINPPIEDLRKLDDLATEVYKIAKGYMKTDELNSSLVSGISSLGGLRRRRRRDIRQNVEVSGEGQAKEHTPISDTIAKESFAQRKRWGG